jgi:putative Mg2+ transporter-C (MgtC) family protein
MEKLTFLADIGVAVICGLLIGFERQWRHKDAGLRTNCLVALGSAIFVLLSKELTENSGDNTRIIAQIVTGIGFLGAGVIFRAGESIHGLTSAATIWCSAAVGCLAASGNYFEALVCTTVVLVINTFLTPIDQYLKNRK